MYKGFLIDLDGTMYRGKEVLPGAKEWIDFLNDRNLSYLFVTNNASRTLEDVAAFLQQLGINTAGEHIFTTSQATAKFLKKKLAGKRIYMIGEKGLHAALEAEGFCIVDENADAVVVGIDRSLTYEKMAKACLEIRKGALFVSTNNDRAIPTERGLVPGNGALTAFLAYSTDTKPFIVGKPEAIIMEQAVEKLGTKKEETLMIGDNYDTDILAGINAGIDTLLVHTGVTTKKMLEKAIVQPTFTANDLLEWLAFVKKQNWLADIL